MLLSNAADGLHFTSAGHMATSCQLHTAWVELKGGQTLEIPTLVCACVWVCMSQPLFLRHSSVDADRGEVLLHQQLVEGHTALDSLDEDDHLEVRQMNMHITKPDLAAHRHQYLVELKQIKEVKQLPVLLTLLQFDVVLL